MIHGVCPLETYSSVVRKASTYNARVGKAISFVMVRRVVYAYIPCPDARYDFVRDPIGAVVGLQETSWISTELFGGLSRLSRSIHEDQ